jgi:hypothetical protein
MAEQDPTKRGQVSSMNPDHTTPVNSTKEVPVLQNPHPLGTDDRGTDEASTAEGAILDPELQAHIGRQLRTVYDGVLNEPVPDRFLKLLEALEREQAGSS